MNKESKIYAEILKIKNNPQITIEEKLKIQKLQQQLEILQRNKTADK